MASCPQPRRRNTPNQTSDVWMLSVSRRPAGVLLGADPRGLCHFEKCHVEQFSTGNDPSNLPAVGTDPAALARARRPGDNRPSAEQLVEAMIPGVQEGL
jgi:hypothetical protein